MQQQSAAMKAARGHAGFEERAQGAVSWRVVGIYTLAAGGISWGVALIIMYIFENGSKAVIDTWAGWWAAKQWGDRGNLFYLGIYALLAVGFAIATYVRSIIFTFGCVRLPSLRSDDAQAIWLTVCKPHMQGSIDHLTRECSAAQSRWNVLGNMLPSAIAVRTPAQLNAIVYRELGSICRSARRCGCTTACSTPSCASPRPSSTQTPLAAS
jgi:hypothetical protein